jgi:site-specific DNA-methyltransferase (adenine-specific)
VRGEHTITYQLFYGDCLDVLPQLPSSSVNLIMTSPPYADARRHTYGGIHPDQYVEWFLPISAQLYRVLDPCGSFILNIKERVVNGERHTYVLEIILALKQQGWLWTEEYIWHKRTCMPGKWSNRFRDAWERCLHFTKQKRFNMYQDAVMVPPTENTVKRGLYIGGNDTVRQASATQSGFNRQIDACVGHALVYPSNVIHIAAETQNQGHSAVYPIPLPLWFIKLFTEEHDIVLDPFSGSNTTGIACLQVGRQYIGIEKDITCFTQGKERLEKGMLWH